MHLPRNALAALLLLPRILLAAPAIEWRADLADTGAATLYARHGDEIGLSCRLTLRGAPYAPASAQCHYQTNGMGAAWWEAPVTVSSNVATVAWSPALDPGADLVLLMLEFDGAHRAAAHLHLRPGPSGDSSLPPPSRVLDFAAVAHTNAPWALPSDIPPAPDLSAYATTGYVASASNALATAIRGKAPASHAHASLSSGAARLELGTNGAATVTAPTGGLAAPVVADGEIAVTYGPGGEGVDPVTAKLSAGQSFKGPFGPFRENGSMYYVLATAADPAGDAEAVAGWTFAQNAGTWVLLSPDAWAFANVIGFDTAAPALGEWQSASDVQGAISLARPNATATRTVATVDLIPAVAPPSESAADGGKAADAYGTGIELAGKLDKAAVAAEAWTLTLTNGVVTNVWVWTGEAPR